MTNRTESVTSASEELLGVSANEFFAAVARGEEPSIEEFTNRYPDIAEHIRCTFPALLLLGNSSTDCSEKEIFPAGEELRTLGDFRLIREIGRGGMGIVYEAEQLSLRRRVALKVLPFAAVLDKQQLARFQSEAYAAATLHHPHIVPVHAVGSDRGVYFYAMQYISGRSLAEVIGELRAGSKEHGARSKGGEEKKRAVELQSSSNTQSAIRNPQSEIATAPIAALSTINTSDSRGYFRTVAKLGIQAASALEYSHANGIVHRDVKPANLLVDDDCKLWVTDFGLARVGSDAGLTMTGDLLGTVRYMSPEQVLGRRTEIDHRTDIYSLGATLYEMLSLRAAYDGDERAELLRRIAVEEPRRLRQIDRRIPVDLETIVGKAMEKHPTDRYSSAQALADDLQRYLASEPIQAKPASRVEKVFKWSRRHHSLVSTLGACLVLLCAVLTTSVVLINRARIDALAALERTSELLYTSDMTDAFRAWEKGWADEVRKILDRQRPDDEKRDRRGLEWYLLDAFSRQPEVTVLAGHRGPVNELAVFPDRRRLASVGSDGTLRICDLDDHSSQTIALTKETMTRSEMELHSVAISPDGRYIAAGGESLHLVDTRNGLAARQIFHGAATIESLAFNGEGTKLAAGVRYEEVCLLSLDGAVINRVPCGLRVDSLEFVPGRPYLLVPNRAPNADNGEKQPGIIQLWHDDLSRVERVFDLGKRPEIRLAKSSPCGRYLVGGEPDDSKAWLIRMDSGEVLDRTLNARDRLTSLSYSPNGEAIALGYVNGIVECFELTHTADGVVFDLGRRLVIDAHHGEVRSLQYVSPRVLASCGSDGLVKLWSVSQLAGRSLMLGKRPLKDIEWSPDGATLACLGESQMMLFDENGASKGRYEIQGRPSGMAWSESGDRIAICCGEPDGFEVLDLNTAEIRAYPNPDTAQSVAISPDGEVIAVIGGKHLRIYGDNGREQIKLEQLPGDGGEAVAFSHDGRRLAYGGRFGSIVVKECPGYRDVIAFPCEDRTVHAVFSPDDLLLATGHSDGMIRIWDLDTHELKAELAGHERLVRKVEFSPDGRCLISHSEDRTLRIWSVDHDRGYGIVHQFSRAGTINRASAIAQLSLSRDGRKLAIGCHDEEGQVEVLIWKLDAPSRVSQR